MTKYWIATALAVLWLIPEPARSQGETTSAIAGQVTDQTGAAIRGASVSIANVDNGLKRSVETDDTGRFNFPQLTPGTYAVQASASGFERRRIQSVSAALGRTTAITLTLVVQAGKQEVTVTEQASGINTENPNTSSTLAAPALENLPNPGGDLTYPLQFAPGALINTAGSGNDFVGSIERLRQCRVQRPARARERLHRRRSREQRPVDQFEQRAIHQPRTGS